MLCLSDPSRSKTPAKPCWNQQADAELDLEEERPSTPVNLRTPSPVELEEPTYESQVDKYGWLAEVHGDPFNLKYVYSTASYNCI